MSEENGNELDGYLPGMKPKKIPKIIEAANAYEREHKARIRQSKKEKHASAALVETMVEFGLTTYEFGDVIVNIADKKTPTVTRTARESSEEKAGAKKKAKVKA